MNANRKLGPEIIYGDPHKQRNIVKQFARIVKRHALIVMNSLKNKFSGIITIKITTTKGNEESIVDFVTVCDLVENMISEVDID